MSAALAAVSASRPRRSAGQPPLARSSLVVSGAQWWTGRRFEKRTGYVVDGRFAGRAPAQGARTVDLTGAFLVPPYGDAHNHGIGTGDAARDLDMIARYRRDGVMYAQSLGNLPWTPADRARLRVGAVAAPAMRIAQGSITGPGGHPVGIIRDRLLPAGYFPGETVASLRGRRFFEVASERDLRAQWPAIRQTGGDVIKCFLFNSGEHDARMNDPAAFGRRGLDPRLLPVVVALAHGERLPVAVHVVDVQDYRTALESGADIISHIPTDGTLDENDARRTAERRVVVITTCAFLARLSGGSRPAVVDRQRGSLRALRAAGAHLAIGTDDPADTGLQEIRHLAELGVFTGAELLELWTGATAKALFPQRRVGTLDDGAEASFLALDADPLADWSNALRIRARYVQGDLVPEPSQ